MSHSKYRQISCGLTKLIVCFLCAAYEIRQGSDLALLTNQNGRYFYKTHLATLHPTQSLCLFAPLIYGAIPPLVGTSRIQCRDDRAPATLVTRMGTCNTFNFNCTKNSSMKATWRSLQYDMPHFETLVS